MADKFLYNNSGNITEKVALTTSVGAGDAGKIVALDNSGRLDTSMMPVGIVPETAAVATSESLSAGDWVNIWNNGGTFSVRKADATSIKPADGFVLSAFVHPTTATVFLEGTNTAVTGASPGRQFLSTTPGFSSNTAPTGTGNIVQKVGTATSATTINFEPQDFIVLA